MFIGESQNTVKQHNTNKQRGHIAVNLDIPPSCTVESSEIEEQFRRWVVKTRQQLLRSFCGLLTAIDTKAAELDLYHHRKRRRI